MDPSRLLYDVPPRLLEELSRILDSGDDRFGWRGLAVHVAPSWLEVRRAEQLEAMGKSPARELLWSWAQQNRTVADLIQVLEDMGHLWALQLLVQQAPNPAGSELKATQRRRFTYQDVLQGTRHFHHQMKMAEGGFSDTYKSTLGEETFAVKLFKRVNDRSWKERWDVFTREMERERLCQHPNILDLLGCVWEDDRYCLVYPYLPNGSLHQRLHHQALPPLTWEQRLAILRGSAAALHHLHAAPSGPVVWGHVTSANILLDAALQPQLSTLGLARLRPPWLLQSCTTTTTTTPVHDHLGYLPPEFIRGGKLCCSLDVYSFGMVVLETITGRKVVEETPKRSLLRDVVVQELEDCGRAVWHFLDQEAGSWPRPLALRLLRLALACTADRRRSRPSMEAVLKELSQLLPPNRHPTPPSSPSPSNQPYEHGDQSPSNQPYEHGDQSPSNQPYEHGDQSPSNQPYEHGDQSPSNQPYEHGDQSPSNQPYEHGDQSPSNQPYEHGDQSPSNQPYEHGDQSPSNQPYEHGDQSPSNQPYEHGDQSPSNQPYEHGDQLALPMTSCPPSPPSPPPPPPPQAVPPPPPPHGDGYGDRYGDRDVGSSGGRESVKPQPCECSQSEVTFRRSRDGVEEAGVADSHPTMQPSGQPTEAETGVGQEVEEVEEVVEAVDLYNSWPVQCSCQADSVELSCEDCRANGFSLEPRSSAITEVLLQQM